MSRIILNVCVFLSLFTAAITTTFLDNGTVTYRHTLDRRKRHDTNGPDVSKDRLHWPWSQADWPGLSAETSGLKRPCVLPPYPSQGTYNVTSNPKAVPGQSLEYFVMMVKCRRGYGIVESGSDSIKVHCSGGEWSQTMPSCVRFCKLNPDPSVTFTCRVPGQGSKACDRYVPPGTAVNAACNPHYYSANNVKYMTCKPFAVWDKYALCKADCGQVTPQAELLLIGGRFAKFGELPWHVGIYDKTEQPYEQVCGGSLVTNNVVLTAAHCFWSDTEKQLPETNYAVASAKQYRQWDDERDIGAQKSDVKEIRIPVLFQGSAANFQQDIAIVFLTTAFVFRPYLKPVCYDFDKVFDAQQLRKDNMGTVAGWGLIAANGGPSPELKVVQMPFVDEQTCLNTVPRSFRAYVSGDKFCAGYNGTGVSVCKGDSGGGLVFPDIERKTEIFYLRGIVSASPRNDDKLCNDLTYSAFTKITEHEKFIIESITASAPKVCDWFLFQCDDGTCVDQGAECNGIKECADGSDESYSLCTPGATTVAPPSSECILPPYPEHGTYEVANNPTARPGQSFDSLVLTVTCTSGFGIQSGDQVDDTLEVYCFDGEWIPPMPKCDRLCKLEPKSGINYKCLDQASNTLKPCNTYVPHDTIVVPECPTNYRSNEVTSNMTCVSGKWNYVAECNTECGRVIPKNEQIPVIKRFSIGAKRGEVPWYVAIYRENGKSLDRDGTLISKDVVITSAILLNSTSKNYVVAVGKFYTKVWNHLRDVYAQNSRVKEIVFPTNKENIAILILASAIKFDKYISPVCLDLDNYIEEQKDNTRKIALYGFNTIDGTGDGTAVFEMTYITDSNKCDSAYQSVDQNLKDLGEVEDKICAEFTDFKSTRFGYTGTGLIFSRNESGVSRHYLQGVLSYNALQCLALDAVMPTVWCKFNENYPSIFTQLSKLINFIRKYI